MTDPNVLLQMVAETAVRQRRDGRKVLEEVLDALWRNFDYVGSGRMRKAVAMGIAALLTTVSASDTLQLADVWRRAIPKYSIGLMGSSVSTS